MVSVIISVYNVAPYIERCLFSILNQSYADLEILAVDDGSTDESGLICDRLARQDKRIKVIHKKNGGNASARNAGIDAAQGEFIAFVDGDDYIESNMYEEMLAEMKKPRVSIVCSGIILTNVEGEVSVLKSKERRLFSNEEALLDFFTREGNVGSSACNKLYRRDVFQGGARYNNEIIHEDTEAMPRFLDATEQVVVMDKAFYHYIKRKNSASTSKHFSFKDYRVLDSMKEYERMCKKKYPKILPYFHYYQLIMSYEMLCMLVSSAERWDYLPQWISLKFQIIRAAIKCMKWKNIREENGDQIKVILAKTVLGVNLVGFLFHLE